MKTLSVQQMPGGFELETPSFWYWVKAGMAFTLGAGFVAIVGSLCWAVVSFGFLAAILRAMSH